MRTTIPFLLLWLAAVPAPAPVAAKGPPEADIEALIVKARDPSTPEAIKQLIELGPDAVPVLTQGLWEDSAAARRTCATVLAQIGADARGAAPSLVRALGDDSKDVRRAAARALGAVGAHSAIPALTRALKDEAPAVRLAAVDSLIALGADAGTVIPVLATALKSDQPDERYFAAGLLGELGPEAAPAVLALQGALVEADPALTVRIAEVLGRIGPEAKTVVPVLKKKVQDDKNADLFRVPAALALWRIARDGDVPELLRAAVAANKGRVRPHAALWRIDPSPETVEAFVKQLKSEDLGEVFAAAEVLEGRSKRTVPLLFETFERLVKFLDGTEEPPPGLNRAQVNEYAQRALAVFGRIGPDAKQALEPVAALAKAKNALSFPAAVAVYQIDPKPDHALALAALLEDKTLRVPAAEALAQLRPTGKAVAIELLTALDDPDEELARAAAVALWRIEKNPSALKTLTRLLRSTDPKVRERAALELGAELGPEAKPAVPDLVKRLFDPRAAVRSTAAEALGRIGPDAKSAAPALLALLDGDEPAFVQSAACEALGLIEPAEKELLAAALKQKLEHPSPLVRAHAALALVRAAGDRSGQEEATRGLAHRFHHVRITAAEALWQINRDKDGPALPLLVRALEESNLGGLESENERYMAARALGRIGPDAKIAVPELLKLLNARDEALATTARTALKLIDPAAAKKAGGGK
jgi:HEAT repeat protein